MIGSKMMEFTAGYPGYWQRELEKDPKFTAIFFAGGVGSHGPKAPEGGLKGAEIIGTSLARQLLDHLDDVKLTSTLTFSMAGLEVDLPDQHLRLTDGLRIRPYWSKRLLHVGPKTYFQAFRFNDLLWASTPCDFSGELVKDLKNSFSDSQTSIAVTSFNGDYIGYIVPGKYYHLPSYETKVMSFFGPYMGDYSYDLLRRLLEGFGD